MCLISTVWKGASLGRKQNGLLHSHPRWNCRQRKPLENRETTTTNVSSLSPTVNRTIQWIAHDQNADLLSESGDVLTVMKDGYYFLSLQVTLNSPCKENPQVEVTMSLKQQPKAEVLLQGTINSNTCSTGLLGKVKVLNARSQLVVAVSPPTVNINDVIDGAKTHLDVIYMQMS